MENLSGILVSVICPVYNEKKHIRQLLDFFVNSKPENKELIIADGNSTDGTREIIVEYISKYNNIFLIENPARFASQGLNKAIKISRGKYICRLDAHTNYPTDYIERCIEAIEETGADNVGGYIYSRGKTIVGRAIAVAMSSHFGVGDTYFRVAMIDAYVDSVPFGFWKREAFEKFGIFDEDLIRNQDDEMNYRINKLIGRVFQSSKITSEYFVRENYLGLFLQYFQYGLYKMLVFKKLRYSGIRTRHLVPFVFCLYLFTIWIAAYNSLWLLPLILYILSAIVFAFHSTENFIVKLFVIPAFFVMHIAYGIGFMTGIWKWRNHNKSK